MTVSPGEPKLSVGAKVALKATALYSNNETDDVAEFVEWTSSDENVASVDEEGVIKGISAGTAIIKGVLEDKTVTVKVTVMSSEIQVKKLVPLKSKIYLKVGKSTSNKITALLYNGTKKVVTANVTLNSSNPCVIIYKNTTLKATAKGTSKITVFYGNASTSYSVVVK